VVDGLIDADSFFEIKPMFAPELVVGFGRLEGHPVGIVRQHPAIRAACCSPTRPTSGPVVNLCNAFNVPLLFLADVPRFMIGYPGRREGIIRHGAR